MTRNPVASLDLFALDERLATLLVRIDAATGRIDEQLLTLDVTAPAAGSFREDSPAAATSPTENTAANDQSVGGIQRLEQLLERLSGERDIAARSQTANELVGQFARLLDERLERDERAAQRNEPPWTEIVAQLERIEARLDEQRAADVARFS